MTSERMDALVSAVRAGATRSSAAEAIGISAPTAGRWVARNAELGERLETAEREFQEEAKTAGLKDALIVGVRRGLSRSSAARLVGIEPTLVSNWLEHDLELGTRLQQAEAECKASLIDIVQDVADKRFPNTWQAAAWLLERRWPDEYGQKSRLDISLDTKEYIQELATRFGLTPEEVGSLQALAEARIVASAPGTHTS